MTTKLLTPAMHKALMKWWAANAAAAPHVLDVRSDVARKLHEGGWLATTDGGGFRAGYAMLRLTERGRDAATSPRNTV